MSSLSPEMQLASILREHEVVDWVGSTDPDDNYSEFTGEEIFDIQAFLDTYNIKEVRELVGESAELITGHDEWDLSLYFATRYCSDPEHKMELTIAMHPDSREEAHGTRLKFEHK